MADASRIRVIRVVIPGPPGSPGPGVQIVDSVAALRTLTAFPATVIIQSYYGDGGRGGGLFHWSPLATAADDGGAIIQPSVGGAGRWIRVY